MKIQQHDGVVVDAGVTAGLRRASARGRGVAGEEGGAKGCRLLPSLPPPLYIGPQGGCAALGDGISQGRRPPGGLYIGGGGRAAAPQPLAPPSPSRDTSPSSRSAWRSPVGILLLPPPRRRATGSPSTSPPPLLDQEGGDVAAPYVC